MCKNADKKSQNISHSRKSSKCIQSPKDEWVHLKNFAAILQRETAFATGSFLPGILNLLKMGLLLKERICSQKEQSLSFKSGFH